MLEINDKTHFINLFENITDLSKYLTSRDTKYNRFSHSLDTGDDDVEFTGVRTFEEALDLMKYGDEDLFNKIKRERKKIDINKIIGAYNQKLKYRNRYYGGIPNVPAYLRGNPVNMINPEKNMPANRILNIFLNIRVRAYVSTDDIIRIGLKYLTIVDILEKSGYRCNLYSGCANESGGYYSYFMVRVKTDKEPLNLKKICFTIAHPSMQRRIKFRWMEVNDFEKDFTRDGYGSDDNPDHTQRILSNKLKDNFIVLTYEDEEKNISAKSEEDILKDLKKKYKIKIGDE